MDKDGMEYKNPELLLMEADAYCIASIAIIKYTSDNVLKDNDFQKASWLNDAASVNHAFAFEMYLKCLLIIEEKELKKNHDLVSLYDLLNPETKNLITLDYEANVIYYPAYFEAVGKDKKVDFRSMLLIIPTAFVWLRYKYQGVGKRKLYELDPLINSVRVTILKLRPELVGFR